MRRPSIETGHNQIPFGEHAFEDAYDFRFKGVDLRPRKNSQTVSFHAALYFVHRHEFGRIMIIGPRKGNRSRQNDADQNKQTSCFQ